MSTQYANLHSDPDEKFYIPENVYIIGTMNDIDRSVDSFDFAMRKGLFKKYVRREYNDGNVKGTIEMARQVRQNTPFNL